MLSLKLLLTDTTDISNGILPFLGSDLSSEERMTFQTQMNEATSLRKEMAKVTGFDNSSSISKVESYVSILLSCIDAFPMELSVNFKWKAYKGRYVKTNSLLSELGCVLYNVVALITQEVSLLVATDTANEAILSEGCKKLAKAYNILLYIRNSLSYSFTDITTIPEMTTESLNGFLHFIYAEYQYLKSCISVCRYKNKSVFFVSLFTAARDLYKKAYEQFLKSPKTVSVDIIEYCKAMSSYCYAYALYYEGYMSPDDLTDYSKHGRGKAYFCMGRYFELTDEILKLSNTAVKAKIIPLIRYNSNAMKEEQRQIVEQWKLTVSHIPSSEAAFHLKPVYCPITKSFDYKPMYDLKESIGHARYAELLEVETQYKERVKNYMDDFKKECDSVIANMNQQLRIFFYNAYEAALMNDSGIPKSILNLLQQVSDKEKEQTFESLETEYQAEKARYQETINKVDDAYADLVNKMHMFPQAYPAEIRTYIEQTLIGYITKKKDGYDQILRGENQPLLKGKDSFFNLIFESSRDRVTDYVRKNLFTLEEDSESIYNVLIKRKTEIDLMLVAFHEAMDRVENVSYSLKALKKDFFGGLNGAAIRSSFDRYLTLCYEEGNMCLNKYKENGVYIRNLEKAIGDVQVVVNGNKCLENKLKLYKALTERVELYEKLVAYYKKTIHEMQHNINGLGQSKMYIDKYFDSVK